MVDDEDEENIVSVSVSGIMSSNAEARKCYENGHRKSFTEYQLVICVPIA